MSIEVIEVQIPGIQGPPGEQGIPGEPSPDLDEILAAQEAAEAAAAAAEAAAAEAEAAAEVAEDAATAASADIYPTTAAGLAAVPEAGYFYVPSTVTNEALILYQDVAGVAVEKTRTPSAPAVADVLSVIPDAAPIGYAGGIADEYGNYSAVFRPDGTTVFHTMEVASLATMIVYGTINSENSDVYSAGYSWGISDADGRFAVALKDDGAFVVTALEQVATINGVGIADYLGGGGSVTTPVGRFDADINHITGYGQSRSTGYDAAPILSTTQPYDSLMFVGGVRPLDTLTAPAAYASLVPLVESPGPTAEAESPMSGMMNCLKERILAENLISYTQHSYQMLASISGVNGTPIDSLDTGSTPFNNVKASIDAGYARAQALGKSYKWRGFTWSHGEADYSSATSAATYESKLIALRSDLDAYAKSITGQTDNAICFLDQLDDHGNYGSPNNPYLALSQLKVCKENAGFVLSTPVYHLGESSGAHHTNVGSRLLGAYHGLAYKRVVIDGTTWIPCQPISVLRQGTIITLRLNVPSGNLTIDNVNLPAVANAGLTLVTAGNVDIPISSVVVTSRDTVRIIASTAPAAGAKLRYAWSASAGNLRDQQGNTITFAGLPMHNWCVIFEEVLV